MRAVIAVLSVAGAAWGQHVDAARRVNAVLNPGAHEYREPAIAVSGVNPKHLIVGWVDMTPPFPLHYAISVNAAATFSEGLLVPVGCIPGAPVFPFADPMVASSMVSDDLWIGGVIYSNLQQGFTVFHNGPGSGLIDLAGSVECRQDLRGTVLDKPFMAVGPRFDAPAVQTLYLFFTDFLAPTPAKPGDVVDQPPGQVFGRVTSDLKTLAWDPARIQVRRSGAGHNEVAVAIIPVVLTGPPHAGRVVCVWRPTNPADPSYPLGRTPETMYSDDGGATWLPPGGPISLDHSGADLIYAVNDVDLPDRAVGVNVNTVPGVAVDPTDSRLVYVVFWGKSSAFTELDGNVDLYVAQSRDGGASFDPKDTLHLTDDLLGDTVEAGPPVDQVLPAIAVDQFHGVNVLYYAQTQTAAGIFFLPKWARITDFAGQVKPSQVTTRALGPAFARPVLTGGGVGSLRDYMMIAASGPLLYATYASTQEASMNIYVNRIDLCRADVSPDGVVDSADLLAFGAAVGTGSAAADVNNDGAVTGEDLSEFVQAFVAGCGAAP